jgi:ABC-2 type transport system permease protein
MSPRLPSPRRLGALLRKEVNATFAQPLLYVVGAVFLLLAGYYVYSDLGFFITFAFGENILENFFQLLLVDLRLVLLLTVPLLTMRLFAEEKKLGTIELLFTYPLSDVEIVLAKLIGCTLAVCALLAATAPTLAYMHGLEPFALGPVACGYLGLALLAVSFVACGMFLSTLTDNQVVAAMSTVGALLLLWIVSWNESTPGTSALSWASRLSLFNHFEGFARGVVETRDLIYFACLVTFASVATLVSLGSRSWPRSRLAPTIVGMAGLLVALGFVDALGERTNVRFDLTPQRRYTLSPHAQRILERLPGDVEVIAFVRSTDARNPTTSDLLERLAAASPRVHQRTVDVNRNPALARRYGIDAYGAVVVASGDKQRVLSQAREDLVVGAMLEVTRVTPKVVAFVRGHGEIDPGDADRARGLSTLAGALRNDGFEVRSLALDAPVPADVSVLVVAGGTEPWRDVELDQLDAWLARGGSLLALLDPRQAPELAAWLGTRGILPRDDVVLDPQNRLYGGEGVSLEVHPPDGATAAGGSAPSSAVVASALDAGVLLSTARSLALEPSARALLESGPQSWATRAIAGAEEGAADFDEASDTRGPLVVAAARELPPADPGARGARLIVIGDLDLATNRFVEFVSNRQLLQAAIGWLVGEEDLIALRPHEKEIGTKQFFLSAGQADSVLLLSTVVVPGASALVALAMVLRRRWSA